MGNPASYESVHLGGGRGGPLILDRCRAFDLFASVDAHLCLEVIFAIKPPGLWLINILERMGWSRKPSLRDCPFKAMQKYRWFVTTSTGWD